ncbi:hypothetical protein DCS_03330 [Drechmeria coniospora]|uniref:Uncharacterized protein n=1 Tax=Drechmeria coniospora TaxID=98403 RepID=A0A151GGZ0_DRECN|nr:hypothetical protein DCS_03330 [Drechmeria coniospora]KYK56332.1 hypothetical protein DCS_03330 [Drechmeria coniospora]
MAKLSTSASHGDASVGFAHGNTIRRRRRISTVVVFRHSLRQRVMVVFEPLPAQDGPASGLVHADHRAPSPQHGAT